MQGPSAASPDKVSPKQQFDLNAFKEAITSNRVTMWEDAKQSEERKTQLEARLQRLNLTSAEKSEVTKELQDKESEALRAKLHKPTINDFQKLAIIGNGAFGIVWLVRRKSTGEIFALKQLKKTELLHKNQLQHVRNERNALSAPEASEWVANLYFSFSDDIFLYMVMEYLPGGDLMTHLIRKDKFTEDETRFYIAELIAALDFVHKELHYVHRDIKPDNIVFDRNGHIKLLDFGLAKFTPPTNTTTTTTTTTNSRGVETHTTTTTTTGGTTSGGLKHTHVQRAVMASVVGTPDYMAPEVYRQEAYGPEVDFWSVGVIMFEMLFGGPPFSDAEHNPEVTAYRVARWKEFFFVPKEPRVSAECESILRMLICDAKNRIKSLDEVKDHPFFKGKIDFNKLRFHANPPIRPLVTSEVDTQNFDDFRGAERDFLTRKGWTAGDVRSEVLAFYGFAFDSTAESKITNSKTDEAVLVKVLGDKAKSATTTSTSLHPAVQTTTGAGHSSTSAGLKIPPPSPGLTQAVQHHQQHSQQQQQQQHADDESKKKGGLFGWFSRD